MKYMAFYLCFMVKDLIGVPYASSQARFFFSCIKEYADNMFFKTYKKFNLEAKG
jgi:hypothetical protein